jgi:hypothetical protein
MTRYPAALAIPAHWLTQFWTIGRSHKGSTCVVAVVPKLLTRSVRINQAILHPKLPGAAHRPLLNAPLHFAGILDGGVPLDVMLSCTSKALARRITSETSFLGFRQDHSRTRAMWKTMLDPSWKKHSSG